MRHNSCSTLLKHFMCVWLLICMSVPGHAEDGNETDVLRRGAQLRSVWKAILNRAPASGIATDSLINDASDAEGEILGYLRARLRLLSGQAIQWDALVLYGGVTMLPEGLLILMEAESNSPSRRLLYTHGLAEVVPLSPWRRQADLSESVYMSDIKPPRPRIPEVNRREMLAIASSFERVGMWDLAWRAYAEAVYSSYVPAWAMENKDETWLSSEASEYWVEAADSVHKAGTADRAQNYLMEAMVFGGDETQDKLKEMARRWSERPTSKPAPVDNDIKRDALTKVVELYVEINAHPRALQVIDENRAVFDDPDTLRKKVEDQWLALVKNASREAEKVTLYGYEVYPHGDPLKVRIPWAFSEGAVNSVRKRLKEVDVNATNP